MQHGPVDVMNREIYKNVQGLHRPGLLDSSPIESQFIGIKQAQTSSVIGTLNFRKHFLKQYAITISLVQKDIRTLTDHLTQSVDLIAIHVDKVMFTKRWFNKQSVQGTAQDHFPGLFGQMKTRSRESVYVDMKEGRIFSFRQDFRILNCISFKYV